MIEGVVNVVSRPLPKKRYEVLKMIDRFGAVTTAQLSKYFHDLSRQTIHLARKQSVELGYIHERQYGMRKLIAITDQGAEIVGKNLKGVTLTNNDMYHQLISNEVLLKYYFRYRDERDHDVTFMTERDIITEMQLSLSTKELKKPNKMKKIQNEIPDFILTIDDKVLAFEIELSRKTNIRIEEKLKKYKNGDKYDAVYYVCGNEYIRKSVGRINDSLNAGMKFLMLDNVIDPEGV